MYRSLWVGDQKLICRVLGGLGTMPLLRGRWDAHVYEVADAARASCKDLLRHAAKRSMSMNLEAPSKRAVWSIVRVAAGHDVRVTLLSADWLRLTTHFFCGTFLCAEGDDCPACALLPGRSYWYLPCIVAGTGGLGILELSATTSADLEQRSKFGGVGLRAGVEVRISRRSRKAPCRCEVVGAYEAMALARLHEWASGLFRIYGFGPLQPDETIEAYGDRIREVVRRRAQVVADRVVASASGRVKGR